MCLEERAPLTLSHHLAGRDIAYEWSIPARDEFDVNQFRAAGREVGGEVLRPTSPFAESRLKDGHRRGQGERAVGVDKIAEAEHGDLLKPEHAASEHSDRASGPEEVVEKGALHPVLVHQQQQFVQLRVADRPRVVGQELLEDRAVRGRHVFHRRAGESLGKSDELVSIQRSLPSAKKGTALSSSSQAALAHYIDRDTVETEWWLLPASCPWNRPLRSPVQARIER
jgi:hypothetical protein